MRALMALVIGMGVLIVAGVAVIGVTIMHRMGGAGGAGPAHTVVLDEPAGTHILSVAPDGDRLAVLLSGGGSDRVVLVSPNGTVSGRIALRR